MIIAVGSKNSVKIKPVEEIFAHHFKDVETIGVSVDSGVSEQPMSTDEMYQGALNRARGALKKVKGASYGVGVEGGIHKYSYGHFENQMVVIVDKKGNVGVGASAGLVLPDRIIKGMENGKSLEQSADELFGTEKIGEGIGVFGIMTKGVVTRAEGVKHGVAFALSRFLHEDLF
jgi:inosine/xanthosine triphosphatase